MRDVGGFGELPFVKREPAKPIPVSFGFRSHAQDPNTKPSMTTQKSSSTEETSHVQYEYSLIDEDEEDIDSDSTYEHALTPREMAFERMGERIAEEMRDKILAFTESLAYGYATEDDALLLAKTIS